MKKIVSLITVLVLLVCLANTAFAADFVPSIGYKDHPEVIPTPDGGMGNLVDGDGNILDVVPEGCLVITPVANAKDSTEIPPEARELLLDVYEQLSNGTMELPYQSDADDYVIRDLFDISLVCADRLEKLEEKGVYLSITLKVNVDADETPVVMVYVDGEWTEIYQVINNGDGTITCLFEDICPVAISVKSGVNVPPAQTGDANGKSLILWVALMVSSAAALVAVTLFHRKREQA